MDWQTKRILILGTTYPSYSRSYTETVCTGGVDEETGELIRIYPVPHRYLEAENRFKTFQWITARVKRHPSDPRPESYRVDANSIKLGGVIPSTDDVVRARILRESPSVVSSVAELKARQRRNGTSLGILAPRSVRAPKLAHRTHAERQEWEEKERELLSQEHLFGERLKPLDFPRYRFLVSWQCADDHCECQSGDRGHEMSLLEWGLHELARKYGGSETGEAKIIEAMQKRLDMNKMDIFLFLGNFRGVLYNFGLMGAYSAPRRDQPDLFE